MKDKIGKLCYINVPSYKETKCNFFIPIDFTYDWMDVENCMVYRVDMCDIICIPPYQYDMFSEYE